MFRLQLYQIYKAPGKKLIEFGLVQVYEKEVQARFLSKEITQQDLLLHLRQQQALHILRKISGHEVVLLHGVTGDRKTEVSLQLTRSVTQQGKQVLILVSEISLTPQTVSQVTTRFGSYVAIYHSGLSVQEKCEQYQLVRRYQVQIMVDTRSAVPVPFDDLDVIITDEERDTSCKQGSSPCYRRRDIALQRGRHHHALAVLVSATPSLKIYAGAIKGVYRLIGMPNRINGSFPDVKLAEMREVVGRGESYLLSNELLAAMHERL